MPVYEERSMSAFYVALGFYISTQTSIALFSFVRKRERVAAAETDAKSGSHEQADVDVEYNQHFAGGKSFGFLATFLTFFSTAYSGYTVSGIPDESSNLGFFSMWWMVAYNVMNGWTLIWKPRVRRLSVVRKYIAYQDPISDRFNNRLLTILVVFAAAAGQMVYVIVQMYSLRGLISTITPESDNVDSQAVAWVLALVMLFAEVLGGMGAVVLTDSIQSSIMIAAMILLPLVATYHFGGVANCVSHDCSNLEMLNCTEGTLLFERGAACKGRVIENGCLGQPTVAPWLTLHPSVGMSEYFKPLWTTSDGNSWPEYPCPNATASMCENTLPGSDVTPATRGFDGSWIFNRANFFYGQFAFGFLSVPFMPNHISRFFTANSDLSLKKASIAQVLIGGIIATLPAVLIGIMAAANLKNQYPRGSNAFGMLVSDFNNRGGFNRFVSVMAGVSAVAAFMSTADSCIISITSMLSRELLQNWLFVIFPRLKSVKLLKGFSIICSTIIIFVATSVALYDPAINDPEGMSYAYLGGYQSFFLSFGAVAYFCVHFLPKASAWALLIGFAASFATYLVLHIGEWGNRVDTLYFTPFADEPKHIYLTDVYWAMLVNALVTVALCQVDLDRWLPTPEFLRINTTAFDPKGQLLRYEQIISAMEGTKEIFKDRMGIGCIVWVFVTVLFSIPQFGKSYDGCTYVSYNAWFAGDGSAVDGCEGPSLCGGVPCWTVPALIFVPLNKLVIAFGFTRWRTIDTKVTALVTKSIGMEQGA